ncbi:hypothetical protein SD77_0178 [Bacillus badius]|uniref:Uncharacterized protein n=1 Tax=Bacillus badius TaxID=1455 RepID=A0ABR5B015_BACBA|nr:hypothetical protein SD77_0178 [Bacillus badius]
MYTRNLKKETKLAYERGLYREAAGQAFLLSIAHMVRYDKERKTFLKGEKHGDCDLVRFCLSVLLYRKAAVGRSISRRFV